MRLTLVQFARLYKHYKNQFDTEMSLWLTHTTYAQAARRAARNEEYF